MNPLATRVVSALVAFAVLVALVYFFEANGLKMLCCLAPVLAQRELSRLLFKDEDSRLLKWAFSLALLIIFACTAFYPNNAALVLGLTTVVFCSLTLFYEKYFQELNNIVSFQAKSLLGFVYGGVLPAVAFQIIDLPQGQFWFLVMLGAVLFGDTFAYLF